MGEWHKADVADVALELGTDLKNGKIFSDNEVKRRSDNRIFNIPSVDSASIVRHIASDASLVLLAVTYILAAVFGRLTESLIGIAMILCFFAFGCFVKYISSKRVSRSYELLLPAAKVTENGRSVRLSVFDVEVGDLISFSQGDIIPADARLVSSSNLFVAQRYVNELTGKTEYKRLEKRHDVIITEEDVAEDFENMVYASSMVVSGKGSAIVTAIGKQTALGRVHSGVSIVSENDKPKFLQSFISSTKKTSLLILFLLVPVSLLGVYSQTVDTSAANDADILYLFLTCLALSVTSMSEIVISPAEAIVTKEIFASSRNTKHSEGGVTKLSAVEELADVDTLLILCPEAMIDKAHHVRRIFFSDKQYRFDALGSRELESFREAILPYFLTTEPRTMNSDAIAVLRYLNATVQTDEARAALPRTRFLKNFPIDGARSCVLKADENNVPLNYIAQSSDPAIVLKCDDFRTEGGGKWQFDDSVRADIESRYNSYLHSGLKVYFYVSRGPQEKFPVFEGMIAVGEEYPFADGALIDEFTESGVSPILVIEDEHDGSLDFIMRCGFIGDRHEAAIASEYARAGLVMSDAPLATKAYIGFGRTGTAQLTRRLIKNGKNILPIIKDSAGRRDVSPITTYATHTEHSYDLVRIASSVSLKPADSATRCGGVLDALKTVKDSSMARLKLGVYKNYLVFSSVLRIAAVAIPILLGRSESAMNAWMILLSGFLCDFAALFAIMLSKGQPVRPKNTANDSKALFSSALALICAICAAVISAALLLICSLLISQGTLPVVSAPLFTAYSVITAELFALGGFLHILKERTRRSGVNFMYIISVAVHCLLMVLQYFVPYSAFDLFSELGVYKIDVSLLPYVLIVGTISFLGIFAVRKISSIALTN